MAKRREPRSIADLLRTPDRFLRSAHLERDFRDPSALDSYIVTPFVRDAFQRIRDGLNPLSGRRTWRVTGDYGVGKSSFALLVAHLLYDSTNHVFIRRLRNEIGLTRGSKSPRLFPILVTGAREGIVPAVARGVHLALQAVPPRRGRLSLATRTLIKRAESTRRRVDGQSLIDLIEAAQAQMAAREMGILLVLDELGKLLEHAALHSDREDVFVLQQLAELAARSGDQPFVILGLLHQGFHAYAERLPSAQRHEWDKVAGRFDEIVFDQPVDHTVALVSGALGVEHRCIPTAILKAARVVSKAAANTGWFGHLSAGNRIDAARFYPLHPMMLPVLVRFFARFGQHERSLFSFLLSTEPFGLQGFAQREPEPSTWYRLADFYDYVRTVFGHRLAGASHRNSWLRIVGTIDSAGDLTIVEERLLKTTAILNLLDADDLVPTDDVLRSAASDPGGEHKVTSAIDRLVGRGMLFRRSATAGYRLWPSTSINLEAVFQSALRTLGRLDAVAPHLRRYIDQSPVLARRHYLSTGTLRYFEVCFAAIDDLNQAQGRRTTADGLIIVALPDTEAEREEARKWATGIVASSPHIVVAIPAPILGLAAELQDVRSWQWVIENTPELSDDPFAGAEASRQLTIATQALNARLEGFIGIRDQLPDDLQLYREGRLLPPRRALPALLSDVCDVMYPAAPLITNELINRNGLSSAAAAARMRLIEGMLTAADRPFVGINVQKAPPERSMYLSVLDKGRIHRESKGHYYLDEPAQDDDPLRLRPAIQHLVKLLEGANGARMPIPVLLGSLRQQPFGVRDGVAPLLLAIVLTTRAHEIAVYENGTFLHRFSPADFLRLVKQPAGFECQLCRVAGVRAEVFRRLVEVFATDSKTVQRRDLLDVVSPLCRFAALLPEFTRRSTDLDSTATKVRDALLGSREPAALIFQELPTACGTEPFPVDGGTDDTRIDYFVETLRAATDALRNAYPALLARMVARIKRAIGENDSGFDRAQLASRAARVSLVAREPRLRAFALRLRDPGLSEDAWVEALGSLVLSKPPARWVPGDELRWGDEVEVLSETFLRVEATAFSAGPKPSVSAIRLGLTRADGREMARVIDMRPDIAEQLAHLIQRVSDVLPQSREMRLAALCRILWDDLGGSADESPLNETQTEGRHMKGRK